MSATKTVVDVLTEARALVAQGWTQGANYQNGCYCVDGALDAASGDLHTALYLRADRVFREASGLHGMFGAIDWNDTPGRTQAEVLAAFDRAIELAKEAAE